MNEKKYFIKMGASPHHDTPTLTIAKMAGSAKVEHVEVPIDGAAAAAECRPVFSDTSSPGDALSWNDWSSFDFAQKDILERAADAAGRVAPWRLDTFKKCPTPAATPARANAPA
jgi:hypothetical protein